MHTRKVMRLLLVFFILFSPVGFSIEWNDVHCGNWNAYQGKVFSLSISTSFHGNSTFKLCKQEDEDKSNYLVTITETFERKQNSIETVKTEIVSITPLDKSQYIKINELFDLALESNLKDTETGTDGSSWCLESQRGFTYTKFCFFTPSSGHEHRGLSGLYKLGGYLWGISNLEERDGFKLY